MPIVTIAGDGVYQAVAEVGLNDLYIWFGDSEDHFTSSVFDAHICAHLAGVTAHTWGGELDTVLLCYFVLFATAATRFTTFVFLRTPARTGESTFAALLLK